MLKATATCERRFRLDEEYAATLRLQQERRADTVRTMRGSTPVRGLCEPESGTVNLLPDLVVGGLKTQNAARSYLASSGKRRSAQQEAAAMREKEANIVKFESKMLKRQFVRQRRGEFLALRQSYYRRRAEIKAQRQGIFGPPLPATALHQWSMREESGAAPTNVLDTVRQCSPIIPPC